MTSKTISLGCLIALAIGFAGPWAVLAASAPEEVGAGGRQAPPAAKDDRSWLPAKSPRKYESPSVERPLVADAKGRTGFIRDWIVLGAFPHPGGRKVWQEPVTPELLKREVNFRKDMLAKAGGETEIRPWLGETVIGEDDQPRVWQSHRGRCQERKRQPGRTLQNGQRDPRTRARLPGLFSEVR